MSDYIKREDAQRALVHTLKDAEIDTACNEQDWYCQGLMDAGVAIDAVPSADVVENIRVLPITTVTENEPIEFAKVVRCKDCKYNPRNPRSWDDDDIVEHYLWCEFMAIESKYNYCSKGKRSEE